MSPRPACEASELRRRIPPIVRTVQLGPDVEIRIRAIVDPASVGDEPVVTLDFFRRSPGDRSPTAWGLSLERSVPLHLSALVADALRHVGARAAEYLAMAGPGASNRGGMG